MSSGRSNEKRIRGGRSNSPTSNVATSATASALESGMDTLLQLSSNPQKSASPSKGNSMDASVTESMAKFQADLNQKDELIGALIHELEQAVEQLDRVKRSGADRSLSNDSSPSLSPFAELTQSRSPLMDDLRQMAEEWEQAQPGTTLARIESELAAVHDLIRNLHREERPRPELGRFEECVRQLAEDVDRPSQTEQDTVNMTLDESSPSWDAIKAQLYESTPSVNPTQSNADDRELLKLLAEIPAPREVNFDHADLNELKLAISERDSYIIQINRLFRTRNDFSMPTDWASLASVPSEMQVRIESLIEHLNVQVRLGEVEMSLERARLARERSYIQSERETIEKHMKRLGLTSLSELDNISAATGTASDRRWMRFLGPNTK